MLALHKVSFSYTLDQKLSYDYEFSLGKPIAIMGKSGSGKTTLLNLIAGFLSPHSGEIIFQEHSWNPLKTQERPVSYLMQNAQLLGHLSVEKNLSLSRAHRDHITEIAQKLGLGNLMDKKAAELSGGQAQRVLLAQVLLQRRSVVLLDEPFKGLDRANRQRSLDIIQEFMDFKKQLLIISTHDNKDVKFFKARKILI